MGLIFDDGVGIRVLMGFVFVDKRVLEGAHVDDAGT